MTFLNDISDTDVLIKVILFLEGLEVVFKWLFIILGIIAFLKIIFFKFHN